MTISRLAASKNVAQQIFSQKPSSLPSAAQLGQVFTEAILRLSFVAYCRLFIAAGIVRNLFIAFFLLMFHPDAWRTAANAKIWARNVPPLLEKNSTVVALRRSQELPTPEASPAAAEDQSQGGVQAGKGAGANSESDALSRSDDPPSGVSQSSNANNSSASRTPPPSSPSGNAGGGGTEGDGTSAPSDQQNSETSSHSDGSANKPEQDDKKKKPTGAPISVPESPTAGGSNPSSSQGQIPEEHYKSAETFLFDKLGITKENGILQRFIAAIGVTDPDVSGKDGNGTQKLSTLLFVRIMRMSAKGSEITVDGKKCTFTEALMSLTSAANPAAALNRALEFIDYEGREKFTTNNSAPDTVLQNRALEVFALLQIFTNAGSQLAAQCTMPNAKDQLSGDEIRALEGIIGSIEGCPCLDVQPKKKPRP